MSLQFDWIHGRARNFFAAALLSRTSALVDTWSVLGDTYALELSPATAPLATDGGQPIILQAIQAALTSPEAHTGTGLHLLVLPALQAVERLQTLLASNATCSAALQRFTSTYLTNITNAISTNFVAQWLVPSAGITDASNKDAASNNGTAMAAAASMAGLDVQAMVNGSGPVPASVPGFTGLGPQEQFVFDLNKGRVMWTAALMNNTRVSMSWLVLSCQSHALLTKLTCDPAAPTRMGYSVANANAEITCLCTAAA